MMLSSITVVVFTLCFSKAYSEYHHGYGQQQQQQLQTVPDFESYGKIEYPHFDIIELGSYQKGDIPPKTIHLTKKIVIKEPKPYPVKVPHPVPYPVPHKVPYPVVHTELVKVPHPVPYPVTKTVPVPVEVPKPYPVPSHELQDSGEGQSGYGGGQNGGDQGNYAEFNQQSGGEQDYGSQDSYNQAQLTYGVPQQVPGKPLGISEYQSQNQNYQVNYQVDHQGDFSGHQEEPQHDQSVNYAALLVPVQNQNSEEQTLHQEYQQTDKQ
ncbi:alpha/beta-gliadin A-V-like [Harmonia axyridis]|uniref:alpha/beta-gliadin A-V-like n=1 Tax=Harmonia axyridis TaxID=115357 RepID=UPI001E276E1E|nr:alpha/beta-gliadin A-V-like [Harmonia axyridis]